MGFAETMLSLLPFMPSSEELPVATPEEKAKAAQQQKVVDNNPISFRDLLFANASTPQGIANALAPPGTVPPVVPAESVINAQLAANKKEQAQLTPEPAKVAPVAKDLNAGYGLGELFYGSDKADTTDTIQATAANGSANIASGSDRIPIRALQPVGGPQSLFDPGAFQDPRIKSFLLQTGLNLLSGGFGSPFQQAGQAVGAGGEAMGRYNKAEQDRQTTNNETGLAQEKLAITRESSRTKRVKEQNSTDAAVAGLHPAAKAFFKQRIHDLNKFDPELDSGTITDRYDQIMRDTQQVDKRTRINEGKLRADEFPDSDVERALTDPKFEKMALDSMRASPTEAALFKRRVMLRRGVTTQKQ
jgi:hypothetical protein